MPTVDGTAHPYAATGTPVFYASVNGADAMWEPAAPGGTPSPRTNISGPLFGSLAGPVFLLLIIANLFFDKLGG